MTQENELTLSLYSESLEAYPELMFVAENKMRIKEAVLWKNEVSKESKSLHHQQQQPPLLLLCAPTAKNGILLHLPPTREKS